MAQHSEQEPMAGGDATVMMWAPWETAESAVDKAEPVEIHLREMRADMAPPPDVR